MKIPIAVVRQERERALQVIVAAPGYPIVWLPRSAVEGGKDIRAGMRDIELDISEWVCHEKGIATWKSNGIA